MPNVNRGSTENSSWWPDAASQPELDSAGAKASSVTAPTKTTRNEAVEFNKPEGKAAFDGDSRTERFLREEFAKLAPGDALELQGTAEVKGGWSGSGEVKIKVERQNDGSFTLEVDGKGDLGVGAPGLGSARIGIGAGTKFHLKDEAATANLADAIFKAGVVETAGTASPLVGDVISKLRSVGVDDDLLNAAGRIGNHMKEVSEVKCNSAASGSLGDELKLKYAGFDLGDVKLKGSATAKDELKFDLETGVFTHNRSMSLSATGKAEFLKFVELGTSMKDTVTLSTVYKMTDEIKAAVKSGKMTQAEAALVLTSRFVPDEVRVKGELELSSNVKSRAGGETKVKVSAEYTLPVTNFDFDRAIDGLANAKWKVESEIGVSIISPSIGVGVASAELSATRRYKSELGDYDLREAITKGKEALADASTDQIATRLALSNAR